jgi:hypothetical protein
VVAQALKRVFTEGRYVLLALATGLIALVLATWLPNLGLVWQIATSESVPFPDKVKILVALIGSIATNFTVLSALSTIAIAVLFGMNVATIAYYVQSQRRLVTRVGQGMTATSLGGLAIGLFGVGCAACGTLVLGPALTFIGASTLITMLPFGGEEFGVLGIAMLGLSLVLSARMMGRPIVCRTHVPTEQYRVRERSVERNNI